MLFCIKLGTAERNFFDMTLDEIATGLAKLKGVVCVAIVDYGSGMIMASHTNDPTFDLEIASAGCVNIIRAKVNIQKRLNSDDVLHDIQINLKKQYHLICPCSNKESTFIYMIADRALANLSTCRRSLFNAEKLVYF